MLNLIILTAIFAIAFAVKGEYQEQLFSNYKRARSKNKIIDRLLDGKILSTIIVIATVFYFGAENPLLFGVAWLVAVSPSMGEEMGIYWKTSPYQQWMPQVKMMGFLEIREGTLYGFKKGVQRGVWGGAAMTLATADFSFLWFSLLYMPINAIGGWVGTNTKYNGWALNEFLFGGIGFGVPAYIWLIT